MALAKLYLKHPALRQGTQAPVYAQATPGLYAFTRTLDNQQFLIVANTATTEQSQTFTMDLTGYKPVVAAQDKTEKKGVVTINLAPLTFAIYQARK